MFLVLGFIGSVVMLILEAVSATHIGYWWSVLPAGLGILAELGVLGVMVEIIGAFGD